MEEQAPIKFNLPTRFGTELHAVEEAILKNRHTAADGDFARRCEEILSAMMGDAPVLLTTSATSALEMMGLLLELSPGDEVILPSYAFVSAANAFALRGATVVLADCDAQGNLSVDEVRRLTNARTRAVCVIHYAGSSCDMNALVDFCAEKRIVLLEDAAQAIGANFQGKPLGSFGALACFSFHQTKNISSGEGGALIVNDPRYLRRAYIIHQKGTNRHDFIYGKVSRYSWRDIGGSHGISEINSACLFEQLKNFKTIQARRQEIWETYHRYFANLKFSDVRVWEPNPYNQQNWHMFALVFDDENSRSEFQKSLKKLGIETATHFEPLHSSPFATSGTNLVRSNSTFPKTDRLSVGLLRFPIYYNLSEQELERVLAAIASASSDRASSPRKSKRG